jgi:tRNA pseudouridine38-40 synthase
MISQKYRYKLIISYDGSNYSGWQVQPNSLSIQEVIEKALLTLFHTPIKVIASGRTDAGVHALGQVAHISLDSPVEEEKLLYSINGLLPRDICVRTLYPASPDFHARFHAKRKVYHYHLHCEKFQDPSKRFYSYHVRYKLDIEALKKAITYFIGTHNFKAFANENEKGSAKNSPIKTIYTINLVEERGGYRLEFEGNGFLYKMVRNIVGTLLDCAAGKLIPEELPALFASEDRKQTSRAAPAHGLFLVRVDYE